VPKHKTNAYTASADVLAQLAGAIAGVTSQGDEEDGDGQENG
jgi:hypothetical protein